MMMKVFITLLFIQIVSACVSGDDVGYDHEVISKSKEIAPLWSKQRKNTLIRNADSFDLVSKSFEVLNLPLGIKTTQLNALSASRELFVGMVFEELSKSSHQKIKEEGKYKNDIRLLAENKHRETARVADIYFERYQSTKRIDPDGKPLDMYKVFVLVSIPATTVPQVMAASQQRLIKE